MRKVSEDMEERRVRFVALSEKSGHRRMEADDLEDDIQILQAGKERGSCASQSDGCCYDPAMVEQVFACGAVHESHAGLILQKIQGSSRSGAPWQQVKREKNEEDWDDEKAASGRYEGATVGLGVDPARHQDASGGRAEEENSTRQEADCMLEKVPALRAGNEIRWTMMKTCD